MHLVPVSVESIRLHQPLPFPLMDKNGVLLAKRSFIIDSREDLADIAQRGGGLFIDVADSEAHHRAYVGRLHGLVRDGKSLGEIAGAKVTGDLLGERNNEDDERPDCWTCRCRPTPCFATVARATSWNDSTNYWVNWGAIRA